MPHQSLLQVNWCRLLIFTADMIYTSKYYMSDGIKGDTVVPLFYNPLI